ncbi:hypothetical protein [Nostoc sp.]
MIFPHDYASVYGERSRSVSQRSDRTLHLWPLFVDQSLKLR